MRLNYAAASSTCKTSESEIHIEEAEIYTPLQRVDHLSRFSLGLRLSNEHRWLKFTLEPNDNIIADNTQLSYVDNGNCIGVCRNMERSAVMAFKGSVWVQGTGKCWDKVGWARICIRKDGPDPLFEGTYSKQKSIYDIQIRPAEMNNTHQWDLRRTISNTTGCPNSRMVASVGIATDCSYTASFDSTDAVIHNVIRMINSASEVFESSFNITLSLGALVVGERCQDLTPDPRTWNIPCSNGSLSHRLDLFSRWRASRRDNHAFWTLMTGCSGAGIGLAWMAQLCNTNFDQHCGTGANVVARTGVEWPVFA
ncbi:Metallo-peptidase family M12-domain-containing protein [Aspergillus pseudonomiae]|uniref:Metallo-peptidase family M12-domain-containing protein n=1 Tax=Aspergillus pseudonomiae TaxID=1506151 RepID=A0A5N7CU53_9EURO|nr:Metallo-peptidase family M12-domain-containing protein [Aspergillus pseudonomiae]KAE8397715.1 Metallo-peptidase family M12-domain-containing protein [Aspergillus pseudonomiae]